MYTGPKRFNLEANDIVVAEYYFEDRAEQMLRYGYRLVHTSPIAVGVVGIFQDIDSEEVFKTPYVLKRYRKGGKFRELCEKFNYEGYRVLTMKDCGLDGYLKRFGIEFELVDPEGPSAAYRAIESYYDGKYARRSGRHYMSHIDEGLAILSQVSNNPELMDAFCLHPIYQDGNDGDLEDSGYLEDISQDAIMFAKDYARVANLYLPNKGSVKDIPEEMMNGIQLMLGADKIQNRKDFEEWNDDHPNADGLKVYFQNWLDILQIDEVMYRAMKRFLLHGVKPF
jgi:hypothetical protein